MRISGHVLIKDEAATIMFSILSVIDYLDEVVVWVDPRTTDNTREIVEHLLLDYPDKIRIVDFKRPMARSMYQTIKNLRFNKPKARTMLLKEQRCGVCFILDGDEVYSKDMIKKIILEIHNSPKEIETWAWTSRYFSKKNMYVGEVVMTRAIRMRPDLHFVEADLKVFPKNENIDWIHDIPATDKGPIHLNPLPHKIIDAWHFHFPFRSSPKYWGEAKIYDGPYPEVFPDNFNFKQLFP